jgi:hypothetical protein
VAVLEKLVWVGRSEWARASRHVFLPLYLDPNEPVETLDASDLPSPRTGTRSPHLDATRTLGTRWFEEERSVVLSIPSAVIPVAKNFLINPFHPDFRALERGQPVPFSWDARLFQRAGGGGGHDA